MAETDGTPVSVVHVIGRLSPRGGIQGLICGLATTVDPRVIEPGVTGYLVDFGDIETHGARLAELAADPSLARRLGESGRRRAHARFGLEAMAANFTRLYQDLARR